MSPKPDRRPTAEASSRRPGHRLVGRASWVVAATLVFATVGPSAVHADTGARSTRVAQHILAIARGVKNENDLNAVILRVDIGRRTVVDAALGHSMTGIPATTDMHFRIGSIAIPYLTTALLQLTEERRLSLDDKVSKWFPAYPNADKITLRMLATATSGYEDYTQNNPEFDEALAANEFRQWTEDELLGIAFAKPPACDPGACFHYAHTNFIVLGKILSRVTGQPVASLLRERVLRPLHLRNTAVSSRPGIAPPVLHAFTRRLAGYPYEDSTFWNPSWSIGTGLIMTGTIDDVARAGPAIGQGRLLSRRAHRQQIAPPDLPAGMTNPKLYYGLGVLVANSWIVQNPQLSGYIGLQGYLPSRRITIAVESTYGPNSNQDVSYSTEIFDRIAANLAPGHAPAVPPG